MKYEPALREQGKTSRQDAGFGDESMRKPDGQRSESGALQPRSDALFPSTRRRNLVGLHAVPAPEQGRAVAGEADRGGGRDWGRGAPPRMEERGSYFNEHPHWGQFQPAREGLGGSFDPSLENSRTPFPAQQNKNRE